MNEGRIKWGELEQKAGSVLATEVSNISQDSFNTLEENFHEYAGLIYDGAFSEHLTSVEKKGLTGENITEEEARKIVEEFYETDKIEEISSQGLSENTDMPSYSFLVTLNNKQTANISISQKGGHIVYANSNREVGDRTISYERADELGKEFCA